MLGFFRTLLAVILLSEYRAELGFALAAALILYVTGWHRPY